MTLNAESFWYTTPGFLINLLKNGRVDIFDFQS